MKKVLVIVAFAMAVAGGFLVGRLDIPWEMNWEFSRGIGQTEVRADYDDTNNAGQVLTQIIVWDEGFENYRIVDRFYIDKDKLYELSEIAGAREADYVGQALF